MTDNPQRMSSFNVEKEYNEEKELPRHVQTDEVEIVPKIKEKSLIRKLDLKLLPAVTLLYLLSFLDRSNGTNLTHLSN